MMILPISTDNVALLLYMSTYIANRVYVLQCLHRELYYTIIKHSYIKE